MPSRAESVRELKRAVQRDLEILLNSRNPFSDLSTAFQEAGHSVLTYGLPDFSSLNVASPADQNRLRQMIENTIRVFEPRLDRRDRRPATGVGNRALPLPASGRPAGHGSGP